MTDLSKLSDAELQALYYTKSAPDYSKMSDAELTALYKAPKDFSVNPADIAKGAGGGLAEGAIGVAGIPGDLGTAASGIVDTIGGKLGIAPDKVTAFKELASRAAMSSPLTAGPAFALNNAPTSAHIKNLVTSNIGELPQPETQLGKYAKTAGEFAPAVLGGPESFGTKLLTRVAAPSVGTEVAGAMTEGTKAEPYARVAGALLGGAGGTKAANVFAERAAAKAAPTTAEVKSAASQTYDSLTNRNIATPLRQSDLDVLATDITTTLNAKGIRPSTASQIHAAVDELKTPATPGMADVADLVAARANIKNLLGAPDANKAGAFVALGKVERAIEQASPGTMRQLREADKNWAVVRANEALDKKFARAELRAAGENSGLNMGNKIRQKVADYLVSNEAKYLSAEQRATLEKVVKGTASQNIVRWASNLMGGGGGLGSTVLGLGGVAAGTYTGNPELAFLPVGGVGARLLSNRLTSGQVAKAAAQLRGGSPYGQSLALPAPATSNPLLTGLLSGLLAAPRN